MAVSDIDIFGRKTFFIAPDASLIPESYMEEFCLHGYEAHIITDDYTCHMREKVEVIIKQFPDSILFFNIDAEISGIDWKTYIRELRKKHAEDALLGVLYQKRSSSRQKEAIENHYVREIGIQAGCIPLQAHHHENFGVMLSVLEKAGAKGRRNYIRAYCNSKSEFSTTIGGKKCKAKIADINITHFRAIFDEKAPDLPIYAKIRDGELKINDYTFTTDAVLIMQRTKEGTHTCVFMFVHDRPDDIPDLRSELLPQVNRKIYQIVATETMEKLRKAFKKADK